MRNIVISVTVYLFAMLAGINSASAQSCEKLFIQTKPFSLGVLETSLDRLLTEQREVRNRVWMPSQIREIGQKGRVEFETSERAVRYYRGLLSWKTRVLEAEIRDLKEAGAIEKYRALGVRRFEVEAVSVDILSNLNALKRALRAADTELQISEPSAQQIAALILVGQHLLKLERDVVTTRGVREEDRLALEASVVRILNANFPSATVDLAKFAKRLLDRNEDRPSCCARGNCPTCTHPNVVFRNTDVQPAPSYLGPEPKSTLPLYLVMDALRAEFPDRSLGTNFWDFVFDPTASRF